jgi:hypothetical protein
MGGGMSGWQQSLGLDWKDQSTFWWWPLLNEAAKAGKETLSLSRRPLMRAAFLLPTDWAISSFSFLS